jgi:hypothetical protein
VAEVHWQLSGRWACAHTENPPFGMDRESLKVMAPSAASDARIPHAAIDTFIPAPPLLVDIIGVG